MEDTITIKTLLLWTGLVFGLFNFIMISVALTTGQNSSFIEHTNIYTPDSSTPSTVYIDKYGPYLFCRFWGDNDPTTYCNSWNNRTLQSNSSNQISPFPCNDCVAWGSSFGTSWERMISEGGSWPNAQNGTVLSAADAKFISKQQGSAAFGVIGAICAFLSMAAAFVLVLIHKEKMTSDLPASPAKVLYIFSTLTAVCCLLVITIWGTVYINFLNSHFAKANMPHNGIRYGASIPLMATSVATTLFLAIIGFVLSRDDASQYSYSEM